MATGQSIQTVLGLYGHHIRLSYRLHMDLRGLISEYILLLDTRHHLRCDSNSPQRILINAVGSQRDTSLVRTKS